MKRNRILFLALLVLLGGVLLSGVIAIGFTRPIRALQAAAQKIDSGDFEISVTSKGKDELGDLAASFNRMSASLKERFLIMRYVSEDTKIMIRKLIAREVSGQGERRNVVVFFSDIRGFTAYSEKRYPEEVVQMLNLVLGRQSAIIKAHGGSIDKYVGDEVVAIFQGVGRFQNAIRAALSIQNDLADLNRSQAAEQRLGVGIGITSGDVVMGSIGSDDHKDFTMIGSNVNLAARLCSGAGAGEIHFTSNIHRELLQDPASTDGVNLENLGARAYKGFSEPIHIFSIRASSIT